MKKFLIISGIAAASLLALAAILLLVAWRASQTVPEFYTRALQADPAEQRKASDTMLQKSTLLVSDVRKSGRWEALFTEEEINGWLAVDLKENHAGALPAAVADPRVVIAPGQLQLAFRTQRGSLQTVLSVAIDAYLAQPGVVALRVRSARAGNLPLPLAGVLDQIGNLGNQQGFLVQWQPAEGAPVALIHIEPVVQGNKVVIIDTLELTDHEIYLGGTTAKPATSPPGK